LGEEAGWFRLHRSCYLPSLLHSVSPAPPSPSQSHPSPRPPGKDVSLVGEGDAPPKADDGADAVALLLRDRATGEVTRMARNEWGTWFRVYQPNKWAIKVAEARAAAAAAAQKTAVVASS
jgi:hypothetical protein